MIRSLYLRWRGKTSVIERAAARNELPSKSFHVLRMDRHLQLGSLKESGVIKSPLSVILIFYVLLLYSERQEWNVVR